MRPLGYNCCSGTTDVLLNLDINNNSCANIPASDCFFHSVLLDSLRWAYLSQREANFLGQHGGLKKRETCWQTRKYGKRGNMNAQMTKAQKNKWRTHKLQTHKQQMQKQQRNEWRTYKCTNVKLMKNTQTHKQQTHEQQRNKWQKHECINDHETNKLRKIIK